MKKRGYPLHEACQFFGYCTSKEGKNRKDCGDCPLHPRAARIFTMPFVLKLLVHGLIGFLLGALLTMTTLE